jgi:hypothetical protein
MEGALSKYQLDAMEETEEMTEEMRETPEGKQTLVREWIRIWEACEEQGTCFYCYNHGKEFLIDPDSRECPLRDADGAEWAKNHANWDTHEIMELVRLQCDKMGIAEPYIHPPTLEEYRKLPLRLQIQWCDCWAMKIDDSPEPQKMCCGRGTCKAWDQT